MRAPRAAPRQPSCARQADRRDLWQSRGRSRMNRHGKPEMLPQEPPLRRARRRSAPRAESDVAFDLQRKSSTRARHEPDVRAFLAHARRF
jgi:hypothetical protein